jgi:hypothetical protein
VKTLSTDSSARPLLFADAAVNLILGGLLLAYPQRLVRLLDLPEVRSTFYPNVLGGVLVGIGIALVLTYRGGGHGLGLDGAIAINICGAGTVAVWLFAVPREFSAGGRITLLVVAVVVLGIGCVEFFHRLRH